MCRLPFCLQENTGKDMDILTKRYVFPCLYQRLTNNTAVLYSKMYRIYYNNHVQYS